MSATSTPQEAEARIKALETALLATGATSLGVDADAHQADKARRKAERDAKADVLEACINFDAASQFEFEKPMYEWKVTGSIPVQRKAGEGDDDDDENKGGWRKVSKSRTVIAQNEGTAWALYCDKIRNWPSRNAVKPEIVRGKRISASKVAALSVQQSGSLNMTGR